jgi:hypothetical protein
LAGSVLVSHVFRIMVNTCTIPLWPFFPIANKSKVYNGLCFDKIINLYFGAPKITTIDIGAQRKKDF